MVNLTEIFIFKKVFKKIFSLISHSPFLLYFKTVLWESDIRKVIFIRQKRTKIQVILSYTTFFANQAKKILADKL